MDNKLLILVIVVVIAFSFYVYRNSDMGANVFGGNETKIKYNKLSPEEAKKIMDGQEPFILLDVRTMSEFKERHIKGAMLIPVNELSERSDKELPDKNALILLYCRSGARSKTATNMLAKLGYTNLYDIGGINSWPYNNIE